MWKSLIKFLLFPWCLGKVLMPSHMRLPNFSLYGSRCPNACFWHRLAQLLARLRSRCIMLRTRKFRPWPSALSEFIVVLQCAAYLFDHMRSIWQHDERSFFLTEPSPCKVALLHMFLQYVKPIYIHLFIPRNDPDTAWCCGISAIPLGAIACGCISWLPLAICDMSSWTICQPCRKNWRPAALNSPSDASLALLVRQYTWMCQLNAKCL